MLEDVPGPVGPGPFAYWCERYTYASEDLDEPDSLARYSARTPDLAIQRIREEARGLLSALPAAQRPVLGWAEGPGRVRAIGALHRGRTCGFTLRHGAGWSEWIVRPYLAFSVDPKALLTVLPTRTGPCTACMPGPQGC
ncbi:hypothetical protein [Streptomyces sp. cmx-18-6]|uniref:hypothetical protein n=1 Tax=Streptomyces sp. cmx-18-6 TaxID=2790930 RepID=UPI00397F95DC